MRVSMFHNRSKTAHFRRLSIFLGYENNKVGLCLMVMDQNNLHSKVLLNHAIQYANATYDTELTTQRIR